MKRVKNIIIAFGIALGAVSCVPKLAYQETKPNFPKHSNTQQPQTQQALPTFSGNSFSTIPFYRI